MLNIKKSQGTTATENFLSNLCDRTFLRPWSYPNPYKSDGKEACDLIAVFENHVFLFFDRESRKFDDSEKDTLTQWRRWEKEAIQKQIKTSNGVKKYVLKSPDKIYLDPKQKIPLPIPIQKKNISVHCIIVAHGANEACKNFSKDNIYGSLAITYNDVISEELSFPFMVNLNKDNPVHIFDSHNLKIILDELDTFYDFNSYIVAKEEAISKYDGLMYCGEEDLLAHYFLNFDDSKNQHFIGVKKNNINRIAVPEGEWFNFIHSNIYKRKKEANKISYFWDELLNRTCDNALNGTLMGDVKNVFNGQSAIQEMAKEPRFMRREFSKRMIQAIKNYPPEKEKFTRNVTLMGSFYKETAHIFLQVHNPNIVDYEKEYRPKRRDMLQIACGAVKNKFPQFSKIVGIVIDAPKHNIRNSEDFALFKCEKWSNNDRKYYEKLNDDFKFFRSKSSKLKEMHSREFPNS